MKKVFIAFTLVTILFLSSFAYAVYDMDILFQGIDWLSDEAEVIQGLISAELLSPGYTDSGSLTDVDGFFLAEDKEMNVRWSTDNKYARVCSGVSVNRMFMRRIAGYIIDDVKLSYTNNGTESRLIAVMINLHNGEYGDIKTKLNAVYGESVHIASDEGIWTDVWYGANESCIMLSTESEGLNYNLIYGRLDAETILDECLNTMNAEVDPADVSGL